MQTTVADTYTTRLLQPPDLRALQTLFELGTDYFERVTGSPPAADEAPRAFVAGPPTKEVNDKRTVGLFAPGGELSGVLDAITDWPDTGTWTVGMLLLAPDHRARGVGSAFLTAWCDWAAREGARRARTALVSDDDRGRQFLERHGWEEKSRLPDYDAGGRRASLVYFTKALPRGAPGG